MVNWVPLGCCNVNVAFGNTDGVMVQMYGWSRMGSWSMYVFAVLMASWTGVLLMWVRVMLVPYWVVVEPCRLVMI